MNRGIARRTVFESGADVCYFLARLAQAVRAGWIEEYGVRLSPPRFARLAANTDNPILRAAVQDTDD